METRETEERPAVVAEPEQPRADGDACTEQADACTEQPVAGTEHAGVCAERSDACTEQAASDERIDDAPAHNLELGRRGEEAAARFLERRGMDILERNWKCIAGEADIIARDEDALHFVEVKTRSSIAQGFPSEAVGPEKRERYERIAAAYLATCEFTGIAVMFDIISIVVTGPNRAFLRFHRNAFAGCE